MAGKVELVWGEFGGGSYTVQYTDDVTAGDWQPAPGFSWPITETSWSGEHIGALAGRYYRVLSE